MNPTSQVAVKSSFPLRYLAFSRILYSVLVKSWILKISFQTLTISNLTSLFEVGIEFVFLLVLCFFFYQYSFHREQRLRCEYDRKNHIFVGNGIPGYGSQELINKDNLAFNADIFRGCRISSLLINQITSSWERGKYEHPYNRLHDGSIRSTGLAQFRSSP